MTKFIIPLLTLGFIISCKTTSPSKKTTHFESKALTEFAVEYQNWTDSIKTAQTNRDTILVKKLETTRSVYFIQKLTQIQATLSDSDKKKWEEYVDGL